MTNNDKNDRDGVLQARTKRLSHVIHDCIVRRAAGEAISDQALLNAHSDLEPELAEALRGLRLVDSAFRLVDKDAAPKWSGFRIRCPHCHDPMDVTEDQQPLEMTCPSCGSAFGIAKEKSSIKKGMLVGHFEILDKLGVGAFGSVWSARDTELDRLVAIKFPHKNHLGAEDMEQFFREARAAARLSHPQIVQVHEVGCEGDRVYLVTDFVKGQNLADWLPDNRVTPREAATLCADLADALDHAHQRGVIHRDLKPSNIMLDAHAAPHLMDFGLARREAGEVTMTADGKLVGTPAYMSPEQARGAAHQADRRSDIYSLGVILFELLTGERPFRGTTRMLVQQTLLEDAPSPRKLNNAVPKDLETICLKCLEKDANRRYQAAAELAEDLRRFLHAQPVKARPITRAERVWRWCVRNPHLSGLAAALMFALVIGFAGITTAWIQVANKSEQAESARQIAENEVTLRRQQQYFSDVAAAHQAWEANDVDRCVQLLQRHVPEPQQTDLRRWEWYYLWNLCKPSLITPSLVLDGLTSAVEFAPDGRLAAAGANTLQFFDPADLGNPLVIDKTHQTPVTGMAFRPPEFRVLATCGLDGALKLWNPDESSKPIVLYSLGENRDKSHDWFLDLSFSPDGRWLAANDPKQKNIVRVWDVDSREVIDSFEDEADIWCVRFSPDGKSVVTAGDAGTVRVFDLRSRRQRVLWSHGDTVDALAFSPDGTTLASAGRDNEIRIGSPTDGQVNVVIPNTHSRFVRELRFSPDGKRLASSGQDLAVKLWDVENGRPLMTLKGHSGTVAGLAFSPDGNTLASAGWDGRVRLWDVSELPARETLTGRNLAFLKNGKTLLSWSGFEVIHKWETSSGHPVVLPSSLPDGASAITISSDGTLLGIGTGGGQVQIRNLMTNEQRELPGRVESAEYVVFSQSGDVLAAASGRALKVWDLETWSLAGHFEVFRANVFHAFALGPEGWTVAFPRDVANGRFPLEIWNLKNDRRVLVDYFTTPIQSTTFSQDGTKVAIGCVDGTVKVWDFMAHAPLLGPFRAHPSNVASLAFSPDLSRLATASFDHTVKLWDVRTGNQLITLRGHANRVLSVAFSPDGRTLATASLDNVVKLWRAASKSEVVETGLRRNQ